MSQLRRLSVFVALAGLLLALLAAFPGRAEAITGAALKSAQTGLCLDVNGDSRATGTPVITYGCKGSANQRWHLTSAGDLRGYDDAMCLGASGSAARAGGRPTVANCNDSAGQKWSRASGSALVQRATGLCLDVSGASSRPGTAVILYPCSGRANQGWSGASPSCTDVICGATVVATDPDIPWGLVTLPDGSVLYSRRDAHQIVRLSPATGATTVVGAVPGAVSTGGEGGVLGLAIASDFASDPWVYVMFTSPSDNRVARIRYSGGSLVTSSMQTLLTGIERNVYHNGGRLRFGPDGMLYVSTGDALDSANAQRLSGTGSLNGKILRMTRTGGVPSGNPFNNYIWSYGHRNPQGLAFDSQGRLWEQEFGNNVMDETNLIVRGGNYGWPQCEGTTGSCGGSLIAPKRTYPTSAGSCSGLAIVGNAVYVACARGERLYRAQISGSSLVGTQQYFVGTYGRLRTVEPAPGGNLWLTTTNDRDTTPNNSSEKVIRLDLR